MSHFKIAANYSSERLFKVIFYLLGYFPFISVPEYSYPFHTHATSPRRARKKNRAVKLAICAFFNYEL